MLSWESLHSVMVGGIAQHVTELAGALERAGHEIHVFTRLAPGQRYYDLIDGVHYHRCPYTGHLDFVDDVNSMCRAFADRLFVVEDMTGDFDLVHAHDWLTANAMIWAKQERDYKSILTIHSTEYARCGNAFPGGRSERVRAQERAGTYWADTVICVSNAVKSEIMWMYEVPDSKSVVVYNGVDSRRFERPIDIEAARGRHGIGPLDPTVLFCGRLEWQKGPDLLLEAIPSVLRRYPNAKFLFAGDGSMRPDLERRARQIGAGDATRFLGCRTGEKVVESFKICDGACVPSRNEPFGIVILEAWSAGKPVVCTEVGGPKEFVRHGFNGLKVYPTPESITWGLNTLLSDSAHARHMGENGRVAVSERFAWDVIAAHTLGAYGFPAAEAVDSPFALLRKPQEAEPIGRRKTGRVRPAAALRQ